MRPENARKGTESGILFTDSAIETGIRDALSRSRELAVDNLLIRVKGGKVTLEGRVAEHLQIARVGDVAAKMSGVRGVENKLTV